MDSVEGRRPLKSREASITKSIAAALCQTGITPNQISMASVLFAGLAAACLSWFPHVDGHALPILAALFIQCRLLCNLFDGMVAVEGGKGTRSGELFNDAPDRFADALILVGAGYAASSHPAAVELGWMAAVLAVMTAYVRVLGASVGAPMDFRGPMAKQHRMALVTFACIVTSIESLAWQPGWTLFTVLIIINLGCLVTLWRRLRAAYRWLEAQHV